MAATEVFGTMKGGLRLPLNDRGERWVLAIDENTRIRSYKEMYDAIVEAFKITKWAPPFLFTDFLTIACGGNREKARKIVKHLKEMYAKRDRYPLAIKPITNEVKQALIAQGCTAIDFEVDYLWDQGFTFPEIIDEDDLPFVRPPFVNKFDNVRVVEPTIRAGRLTTVTEDEIMWLALAMRMVNSYDVIHFKNGGVITHINEISSELDFGTEADIFGCKLIHPPGKRSSGCYKGICDTTAETLSYFPLIDRDGDYFSRETIPLAQIRSHKPILDLLHPDRKWTSAAGHAALSHVGRPGSHHEMDGFIYHYFKEALKKYRNSYDLKRIPGIGSLRAVEEEFQPPRPYSAGDPTAGADAEASGSVWSG